MSVVFCDGLQRILFRSFNTNLRGFMADHMRVMLFNTFKRNDIKPLTSLGGSVDVVEDPCQIGIVDCIVKEERDGQDDSKQQGVFNVRDATLRDNLEQSRKIRESTIDVE
ncbi:hypothetical protein QJS04_geneDACA023091 [Acorus gramineus]|uniref:Uncharacterized protein n=1 Tax=Acorus gramineus TaxID=55184 RepID=A0AAV9A1D4_ACOGR|nr:hypothetical protein QJS04_geneDACA023091 [Acorus gramineus]